MNGYRIRLVLATAVISASVTVLVLKFAGYLDQPAEGPSLLLFPSQPQQLDLSAWRIDCQGHIALANNGGSAQWLLDSGGKIVSCQRAPAP